MRRPAILVAVALNLGPAALAGQKDPAALPRPLRAHVESERFQTVTSVRGLPLGVREAMQSLFGTPSLQMAEPGAEFQATDVMMKPGLPSRRLVTAGCSTDHCLVYYERGGFAHTWHVALFHWTPELTRFEWGGAAPGAMANIEAVRTALLSDKIKGGSSF